MKRWFICLALYITLLGCAPGDIVIVRPTRSDQLLAHTEWLLEYALIDGQENKRWGRLTFYDESIYIRDGCAGQWYEPVGDDAVYMASEQGEFALAETKNVLPDDLEGVVCEKIDFETGTTEGITTPWFSSAFDQVVAYERQDEELHLYFPGDRSNILVFRSATAQTLTREIAAPNPAGQILDDTSWVLDHAIIDGEVRPLMFHETFEINFLARSVRVYDGCNPMVYKDQNGQPSYVAADNGDFAFPWGALYMESTLEVCALEINGDVRRVDGPDFMPEFEAIVAYALDAGQLRLYYPEDKRNVLVFKPRIVVPRPVGTPEPTVTTRPGQTSGLTPERPTPWSAYLAPSTPYPTPSAPYPSPLTPIPSPTLLLYP